MPLGTVDVLAGGAVLGLVMVASGTSVVRLLESLVGRRFSLTSVERAVLGLYAGGGTLFVLASLPFAAYSAPLVLALLTVGGAVTVVRWARHARRHRWPPTDVRNWPVAGLALLFLGLVVLEVVTTTRILLPNPYDGSVASLFVKLILSGHGVPTTLEPFAASGVVYPQGSAVWMTLPVILFGWPIVSAPVVLPPFFLALSVVGVYGWGERLGGVGTPVGRRTGLLFALFFGLVASWPRLFIGGSYDFAFGLPLFFTLLGLLLPFVRSRRRPWKEVIVFALAMGVLTSLSVAAGETAALIFLASLLAFHPARRAEARGLVARATAVVAISTAFVARSLIGLVAWFSYPAHVLAAVGNPPYGPEIPPSTYVAGTLAGNLNPFVPGKPRMAPIPLAALELQVLLAVAVALLLWALLRRNGRVVGSRPIATIRPVLVAALTTFLTAGLLVALSDATAGTSPLLSVTSLYETLFLVFTFYETVALFPLLVALDRIGSARTGTAPGGATPRAPSASSDRPSRRGGPRGLVLRPVVATWLAVALLALPLAVGAGITAVDVPTYLETHMAEFTNATSADLSALEWAGAHLPTCSRVLVAPGSAAQFLPLFATVNVVFPMEPASNNLSYSVAVSDLTNGTYGNATRAALLFLGITEVFVTGQTSVSYLPFLTRGLSGSSDFSVQFDEGDAEVFLFGPGAAASHCLPH